MMQIVEVRFIEDTQGTMTGNEFYLAGATAHFYAAQANVLVERGRVVLTEPERFEEETIPSTSVPVPEPQSEPKEELLPDYSAMKVKELRAEAKATGIKGFAKMKKADLITVLEKQT